MLPGLQFAIACMCASVLTRPKQFGKRRHLVDISSIIFARWQHASRSYYCGSSNNFATRAATWRNCAVHLGLPFWGSGGRRGSAMAPFERAMVVSYRLSIVNIALSLTIRPQFAVECLRRSNKQVKGHFVAKFRKERVDRYKPNFKVIWKRHGVVIRKRNRIDILCRLSTMHERVRQTDKRSTDRPRNDNIDPQ